ncbi:MAG: hypothetical protein ACXW2L_16085 [Burkholderiales bacterium]
MTDARAQLARARQELADARQELDNAPRGAPRQRATERVNRAERALEQPQTSVSQARH